MDEQTRQVRFLVVIAAVICALLIGYNAFYVPDAPLSEPTVKVDLTSSASSSASPTSAAASSVNESSAPEAASAKVNINTATAAELSERLDGIGDTLAQRIVSYREQHGAFRTPEDLMNVPGIGEKKYEKISSFITTS
jgi:competence protein ComEA